MEIKNAIVTGAASGMGRISAKRLAADGVRVAAVDINEENLNQLRQESNNISIFPCDLSDSSAVKSMMDEVKSQMGPIDRVTHAGAVMPMGKVKDFQLRIPDAKTKAVKALQEINLKVIAAGDSYNDTGMLKQAEAGILFRAPDNVVEEFPQFPVTLNYVEFK